MGEHVASVFISYSHQDQTLIHTVAEILQTENFHVWLDKWDLRAGDSLVERISESLDQVDFVAAFVSPASVDSQWCQKEVSLAMTGEIANEGIRVLPVRIGEVEMPASLKDKFYIDAAEQGANEVAEQLARHMLGHMAPSRAIPPRRLRPRSTTNQSSDVPGPIMIVGVDAQGISTPRNDDTRGSALYRVPILLSREPDRMWADLMVQNWDRPPQWTSMHRPGIGSVVGRTFVLNKTTLEEVERHHLETLQLAINATNTQYEQIARRQRMQEEAAVAAQQRHEEQVASAVDRINSQLDEDRQN
ncbi:toll/interleukin-1 receptor domain-containing protein [Rothia koreensis]|uniref:toll/interleukin-1 receptor domain-containing protein n=1 Tax=Rothia koreensis TaxID=592378 RepID=UPI0037CBB28B